MAKRALRIDSSGAEFDLPLSQFFSLSRPMRALPVKRLTEAILRQRLTWRIPWRIRPANCCILGLFKSVNSTFFQRQESDTLLSKFSGLSSPLASAIDFAPAAGDWEISSQRR